MGTTHGFPRRKWSTYCEISWDFHMWTRGYALYQRRPWPRQPYWTTSISARFFGAEIKASSGKRVMLLFLFMLPDLDLGRSKSTPIGFTPSDSVSIKKLTHVGKTMINHPPNHRNHHSQMGGLLFYHVLPTLFEDRGWNHHLHGRSNAGPRRFRCRRAGPRVGSRRPWSNDSGWVRPVRLKCNVYNPSYGGSKLIVNHG